MLRSAILLVGFLLALSLALIAQAVSGWGAAGAVAAVALVAYAVFEWATGTGRLSRSGGSPSPGRRTRGPRR